MHLHGSSRASWMLFSIMNRKDQRFLDSVDGDWVTVCRNEWELLTCILLDARTPLERLRATAQRLREWDLLDYRKMQKEWQVYDGAKAVESRLRQTKYPWAKQKSVLFNQDIEAICPNGLRNASFEELDAIKGIGPKLASLMMRILHPERMNDYVVIDTHVRRWLRDECKIDDKHSSYEELSRILREEARLRGITVTELDELLVENGIAKRRKQYESIKPVPLRKVEVK